MRITSRLALLLVVTAGTAADELIQREVSRLRLRPRAEIHARSVTLADVLVFTDADPRLADEIGDKPLSADPQAPTQTIITHEQVVRRLDELGVNLARVLICGAARCQVTLEPPRTAQTPATSLPSPSTVLPTPAPLFKTRRTGSGNTLANAVETFVNNELTALGGTAEVEFERAGQEFLGLTRPPWEFLVRAKGGDRLGLREFEVVIRRDGRTQRTVRLAVRVKLIKNVLVARKPLGIGTFVRSEDVSFEQRIFERRKDLGLDEPGQIVGQQVKRYIPVGEMIRRSDIKAVDLVKRSRPVSVSDGGRGSVRIHLTGIALDSGGYGDIVRVRIGESRKDRRVLRGVVSGVGNVRLIDDGA